MSHSNIVERANPYSKWFLLSMCVFFPLLIVVYYTRFLLEMQMPLVYFIPIFLIGSIGLMVVLYRQVNGNLPLIPFLVGVFSIVGGAAFDMIATVAKSPDLTLEANPVARSLLDTGYSVEFVYVYSLLAQILIVALGCVMWASFLRHRKILIASAISAKPKSYLEFAKAATGAGHLSWRQCFLPLSLSDLPMSYHMVWSFVVIWVGMSPYRWYMGFEWLSGVHGFRYQVLVLLMSLSLIGYAIWLWFEYPQKSKKFL
jgi:hypothetical protein